MAVQLNPYLSFRDNARQAMEFYQSVFGGELQLSTFADFQASQDPAEQDRIMHGQLTTPEGLVLMGADTPKAMGYTPSAGFSVSLSGAPEDEKRLRSCWDALIEGGTVQEPLAQAPWGDLFGMCTDRYGISWLVNIGAPPQT